MQVAAFIFQVILHKKTSLKTLRNNVFRPKNKALPTPVTISVGF